MKKYVLALDEGTTSARAVVFDVKGKVVSVSQREFAQIYPKEGWVEHDPMEIYSCQYGVMTEAITKMDIDPEEIAAIGITNQRETAVVWDRHTGKPVYNAIVWQCRRTAELCEQLKKDGYEEYIRRVTGLPTDAYFSGTKVKWILDNVEGARERAEKGDLIFGTVDSWLLWKLTNGKKHLTDRTNASRTMLFDIEKLDWDEKLLSLFGIPRSMLPEVCCSASDFGTVNIQGTEIPVCGIAGDQQAALFGQGCFEKGDVKNTYGTGCFLLMNCGDSPIISSNGLISTVAASSDCNKKSYALEGSVFVGGAVIQWLRDELGFISESTDSEYFARKVDDCGGVYVVPAFAGLGAPYWDMYARGTITGLTRGSNRNHIIRAALESIAYQTEDLLEAMRADTGNRLNSLCVDGGACANGLLMQFQADISATVVRRRKMSEATALGAAFLAGLTCGFWKHEEELKELLSQEDIFMPNMASDIRNKKLKGWRRAVDCARRGEIDE